VFQRKLASAGNPDYAFFFPSRRSATQTLMIDWRGTPSRFASLSSEWIIQIGKSKLTHTGGRATHVCALSTYPRVGRSPPLAAPE